MVFPLIQHIFEKHICEMFHGNHNDGFYNRYNNELAMHKYSFPVALSDGMLYQTQRHVCNVEDFL